MVDPLYRFYRERWQEVAQIEIEEQRRTTPTQRWEQFEKIMGLVKALGVQLQPDTEGEFEIWERWAKLKTIQ